VLDLMAAARAMLDADPRNRLALVGGGEASAAVAQAATELGQELAKRILVLGPQPADQVAVWMAACNLLVLPSWNEGTPNVVLEALASGRRVVASNVGGVPDLITEPLLGVMVPPRQPAALAEALVRELGVAYAPDEVSAKGARGGWDASAEALHQVLVEAVGR
jgi:glycosyltransferase involved in cell wall biosynthesis